MSYPSIDTLQKVLSEQVFFHTKDAKKAAGRALGTMIEIISFYLLKEWGIEDSISIEKGLSEYGNPSITHNVEFTLHPLLKCEETTITNKLPLTSSKILKELRVEKEFKAKLKTIAHNAVGDACTGSNPNPIDDEKMADLFECCYYNKPYKF